MADDFGEALARVTSAELPHARRNPDRLAAMIERLAHALGMTIAVGSGGESSQAATLIDGAQNYLDETVADLLPMGRLIRGPGE